jgi:hypothetical protein
MDPEATLAILRETSQRVLTMLDNPNPVPGINYADYARTIAEHFQALDEWLARGGFQPKDWTRAN